MTGESRQFQILHRDFLSRMVDLELVSSGGDTRDVITRFGALLGALSLVIAYLMVPRYLTSSYSHARLARLAWSDEEFLISATIAVTGLCAVLTWNNVFPDKRDSLVLGLLPVRMKTMMLARLAAIVTVVIAVIAAMNIFTGISFPFALAAGFVDGIAAFAAWWLTLCAAGIFIFCSALVVQGVAAQVLPWRVFLRISGLLQIVALFTVLAFFFLTPPFGSADPPAFIPSFWFVGLLHGLRGDWSAPMNMLAMRALIGLAVVVPLAAIVYALSWTRNMRRIVESPDILPAKNPRIANALARMLCPAPFARAILQFTARTIARSRQHRLMLAIYGGFGLALSVGFARSLLESGRRFSTAWNGPSVPFLLVSGALVLSCAVIGIRTIFVFPFALRSNWIFRITAVHRPSAYFEAVRRTLYATAALPVLALLSVWYLAIWPGRVSVGHMIVLTLLAMTLVERSLYQFRKIPFTCSWLPGGTQRSLKRGIWGMVFLLFLDMVIGLEYWSLGKLARLIVVVGIFGAMAVRSRMRTTEFARDSFNTVQFEEAPPSEIFALDLRQDGAWLGDEAYVDAIDPNFGRSLAVRARPFAIGFVVLLLAGFLYEQAGEWRDHRRYPQIGRSVDIGGRSLNIYCSGEGSPTVIFDSGSGQPGYSWILVQPKVAKMTRACWYDRAGYGWSDPASEPRTSADIAGDLHKLLRAAGVPPPYLLVGHSFGGFNVRIYADRYRNETAGMVLVDSADEFEQPMSESAQSEPDLYWRAMLKAADVAFHFGVGRLFIDETSVPYGRLSAYDSAVMNSVEFQEKSFEATFWENRGVSAAQVRAIRSLGGIPLVVLTAAATLPPPGSAMAAGWAEHMRSRVYGTQARLATLSTRGKQIILEYSSHDIPANAPDEVVSAVGAVLSDERSARR